MKKILSIKILTIFWAIFLAKNFAFGINWCSNWVFADIKTFSWASETTCAITKNVAKDEKNIYFDFSGSKILSWAQAVSFQYLAWDWNYEYFQDANSKYICHESFGCEKITDSKTFNILKDKKQNLSPFSYDWKNIYFEYKKLVRVDKNAFSVIQWKFWEDKNYFFRWTDKASKTKVENICVALGLQAGWNDNKNISRYENIYKFVPLSTGQQMQYILSWKNLVTKIFEIKFWPDIC